MENDEPIASAVLDVATAATHLLTVAEALAGQYGEETARSALLVACVTFAERDLGRAGLDELRGKIAALLSDPAIEAAVRQWLH